MFELANFMPNWIQNLAAPGNRAETTWHYNGTTYRFYGPDSNRLCTFYVTKNGHWRIFL